MMSIELTDETKDSFGIVAGIKYNLELFPTFENKRATRREETFPDRMNLLPRRAGFSSGQY
jgi:hypothetical protein